MEVKKSPKAELESKRLLYLLIGYVVSLSLLYVAFEWGTRDVNKVKVEGVSDIIAEEDIEITTQDQTPPPPPPPAPAPVVVTEVLNVVEDNAKVKDQEILTTEDTKAPVQQVYTPPVVEEEEESSQQIFTIVEDQPEFPGGQSALMQYLAKSIKYPTVAQENGIQGRVICSFVINKDGKIVDAEVVRGVDPSLDKEALRVVNSMPPWKPGKQRGKPVRVKFTLPITFRLQ